MARYLVRFAKLGPLRFLSHLDTVEIFKRALRRAGVPVAYSQGNVPAMRIAILHPLPVGAESECEYLNLELRAGVPTAWMVERLAPQLPSGLEVRAVRTAYRKFSYPRFDFTYRVEVVEGEAKLPSESRVRELLEQDEVPLVRHKKGKERTDDVRPFIRELYRGPDHVRMRLAAVEGQSVRPEEVFTLLTADRPGADSPGAGSASARRDEASPRPTLRIRKLEVDYGD